MCAVGRGRASTTARPWSRSRAMDHKGLTDVEFIQVIDGQSFIIRCRVCDGTGRRPDRVDADLKIVKFEVNPCGICHGKGMLRLKSPDIPVNCGVCHGTARYYLDLGQPTS